MIRLLLALLVISGCRSSPAEPPSKVPPPSPELAVDAGSDTQEPPEQFTGAPVAVTPLVLLHQNGAFRVQTQRWKLGSTTGVLWLASVPREAKVRVAPSKDVVPFADLLPASPGPWAAINGGFYEQVPLGPDHRAMGLVVANGVTHSKRTKRGGSGIFYVDDAGPQIVHRKDYAATRPQQALQSIDRIVDQGVSLVKQRPDQAGAMRSAVALTDDAVWLVAAAADADIQKTAHGVQLSRSADGLPLWAFAAYLVDTVGATEALNLDGGISTQLAVRDGDYRLDVRGVQGTINAIIIEP